MTAHHEIGPSAAARWATCTASVVHTRGMAEAEVEPEWTREGSWLHDLCHQALLYGVLPPVGVTDGEFVLDAELQSYMADGLDYIDEWRFDEVEVEKRVDCSKVWPGMFGTLDYGGVCYDPPSMLVFDWKWGRGVPVSPVRNLQQTIYAIGFDDGSLPDEAEVTFAIWQPRIPGAGGTWTTDLRWVRAQAELLRRKAEEAMSGRGRFVPSDSACKFCPAAKLDRCDAHAAWALQAVLMRLEDLDDAGRPLPRAEKMTNARRAEAVKRAPALRKWLREVEARLTQELQASGPAHGLKTVRGRAGDRAWSDPLAAARELEGAGVEAYQKKVISPAAAEKLVSPKRFAKLKRYVTQAPGAPSLAPLDDPRPALRPAANLLEDLE